MQKLPTLHRPAEVQIWVKRHVDKKDIPMEIKPKPYGSLFMKWWRALQPSWRRGQVEGVLEKDVPRGEKWDGLAKGGTAGIYVVVMALSWWIKAIETPAPEGEAWGVVQDLCWVLTQIQSAIAETGDGSQGVKRCNDSEGGKRTKR